MKSRFVILPLVLGMFWSPCFAQETTFFAVALDGLGFTTTVTIDNQSPGSQDAVVEFIARDEVPWPVASLGTAFPDCGDGCFTISLGPGSSFSGQTPGNSDPDRGYFKVTAPADVVASASISGAGGCFVPDIPGSQTQVTRAVFPVSWNAEGVGTSTAVTYIFFDGDPTVNWTVKNAQGVVLDGVSGPVDFGLGWDFSILAENSDLDSIATPFSGTIEYESDIPAYAFLGEWDYSAFCFSFPEDSIQQPLPEPDPMPGQTQHTLYFGQFGNGATGGITLKSDVVLPNPSATQTASGTVSFSKADGSPFSTEVEGEGTTSSVDFMVPPLASTTISTTGEGEFGTGTAVVSSDVPLGGVIRFEISAPPGVGSGIAGVPASQPVSGFTTPARRLAGGINTGVAIRNVGTEEVNLNLSLRGDNGVEVPSGSAARAITGNGQLVDFINGLFSDADTNNFVGSVVVTSDGMIAATALEQGVNPGEFTTLPVTPLE